MFSKIIRPQRFFNRFANVRYFSNRKVFVDVETTGLNHYRDKIVEMCAREYINGKQGAVWHTYLNPKRKMSHKAQQCTQIPINVLKKSVEFKNIAKSFKEFVGDDELIAHNMCFDIHFLNSELKRQGIKPLQNEKFCTLKLARKLFPKQKNSLDALCDRLNIDRSSREKGHGADIDTELLKQVYEKLLIEAKTKENYDEIIKYARYCIPNTKWE